MLKTYKKVLAVVSASALVVTSSMFFVNGAALNGATAVYDDAADTITVTVVKNFTLDEIETWSVTESDGTPVASGDSTEVTEADGSFVITDAVNFDGLLADVYSVSFITVGGDFGATVVYVGNDNVVNVTANVLPLLSMSLSANTLDFGNLNIGANSVNLDVTTATNAANGVTVSMASLGLATGDTASDKHIGNLQRVGSVATTGTDSYTVTSTSPDGGTVLTDANVASSQSVLVADNVAKANTVTNVALTATIDAETEAGNYDDTLTFTVTGTF